MTMKLPSALPPGTRTFSRRELLSLLATGAAGAALAPSLVSLLARDALAQGTKLAQKRLILLWLEGGPSQLETFDPKPGTAVGGPTKGLATDVPG